MKIFKFMDNHDLLPESLTENLIYYQSALLSNLGSINCDSIYHHLTDFGTNEALITFGRIKDEPKVIDGNVEISAAKDITIGKDENKDTKVVANVNSENNGGNMQLTAGDTVNIISGTVDADNSLSIKGNNSVNISQDITAGSVDIGNSYRN